SVSVSGCSAADAMARSARGAASVATEASPIARRTALLRMSVPLDDAGNDRLAGEVQAQVLDLLVAHRLAGLDGGAADVRKQHRVVQLEELRRDPRLVDEDVEPGAGDLVFLEVAKKDGLVDHRAARDVADIALRPERVEHLRAHQDLRLGAARG